MVNAIIWFRKNLRIHDNPALIEASTHEVTNLFPIYIHEPNHKMGENRLKFLHESLQDLDQSLRALGNQLIVLNGI